MGQLKAPLRPKTPIRLTERDKRILEAIHAFDGMLSLKQIDRAFFSGESRTQPRARMRALIQHGYVNAPDATDRYKVPMGESIYWLNSKGAEVVASIHGVSLAELLWRKQPRWSWLSHDLRVNDFRLNVMEACQKSADLRLNYWIPEGQFLASPDTVHIKEGNWKTKRRQIRPDGFFVIHRPIRERSANGEEFAFLLEIDMATHSNPRFAREKVRAGVAYLKSEAYRNRFGLRYGRWLVVTTGEQRLMHLKAQTERAGGSKLFYFTTFDQVFSDDLLTKPIWWQAGSETMTLLISPR